MEKTLFEKLYAVNVNEKVEKKANLSYLSWAWAWAEVKKVDPKAIAIVHEFPLPNVEGVTVPYLQTPTGYFVKVSVTILDHTETEWLPVMDHRNKTMMEPTAFDINKNTKRCLVKAIALHGLGLYIYAGEDLPEGDPIEQKQVGTIKILGKTLATHHKLEENDIYAKILKTSGKVDLTKLTKQQAEDLINRLEEGKKKIEVQNV